MKKKAIYILAAIPALGVVVLFAYDYWRDRPIEGGVVAYRAADKEARDHIYCACNGEGFLIVRNDYVLWYVKDHDDLSALGKIESQQNGKIEFNEIHHSTLLPKKDERCTMRITQDSAHVETDEYQYRLKKTYLGPEIATRVNSFDYESWRAEKKE